MEKELLPLGSIVLLKGGKKKLMITGYLVSTLEYPDRTFDYCGCMYPEGTIRSDTTCVFDHSEINKVIFKGYMDIEEKEYLNNLKKYNNKTIEK